VRALIIRPFGFKNGVDFDAVERDLIRPALASLDIWSSTAPQLLERGSIRTDLLELLITSDLVLVDVSLATPDVFYCLGLAHALRDKRTVLLRAITSEQAFDMASIHCFQYDTSQPGLRIQEMISLLRTTQASNEIDSPVYSLLSGLERPRATVVPLDFMEEVETASRNGDVGHLRLISHEARSFHWAAEALKHVGNAQFRWRDQLGARDTFEFVASLEPGNTKVNLKLGTVYQRLKQSRKSDQAIRRALENHDLDPTDRAEAYALLGRNAREAWMESWRSQSEPQRRHEALRSTSLQEAYEYYLRAFKEDLNIYYGGLNALGLGTIIVDLAKALPEVWANGFEDDQAAGHQLSSLEQELDAIRSAVELSLEGARRRQPEDIWVLVSTADFTFFTSNRPRRVAEVYRRAISGAEPFIASSVLQQLRIYDDLGVLQENAKAAIEVVGVGAEKPASAAPAEVRRSLLFVGHAIDEPNRPVPRFPPNQESAARQAISQTVAELTGDHRADFLGIAGGSSGGDILFHEVCEELSIPGIICLGIPPPAYLESGVAAAGPLWERRFRDLIARRGYRVLSNTPELPLWLSANAPPNYDFWYRDTLWRYHTAAAIGDISVLALWDGKEGAAANMMQLAKEGGAKIVVLNPARLSDSMQTTSSP
jgi:tetratricopeptide (TPR) repeat protein